MALMSLLLLIALCLNQTYCGVDGRRSITEDEEDLELERQLKIINKPSIKTIQTEVGDVYACVDIQQQPALDHPKLKNHKVQMRPTSYPEELSDAKVSSSSSKDEHARAKLLRIGCPEGTVPIKRVGKEELRSLKYLSESLGFTNEVRPQEAKYPGVHQAVVRVMKAGETNQGIRADINIYNLTIAPQHYSTTLLRVSLDSDGIANALRAGWMVSPMLGDGLTRFFVSWNTAIEPGHGCINTLCPGFVVTSKAHTVGAPITTISVYGGVQYALDVYLFQDQTSGNWWVNVENESLGYWPKELVPVIQNGAGSVAWGGFTIGPSNENSSPMGNGHFPEGSFTTSCFFKSMKVVDASNTLVNPPENDIYSYADCESSYRISYYGDQKEIGYTMLYGGPGGKCD